MIEVKWGIDENTLGCTRVQSNKTLKNFLPNQRFQYTFSYQMIPPPQFSQNRNISTMVFELGFLRTIEPSWTDQVAHLTVMTSTRTKTIVWDALQKRVELGTGW